MIHIRDKYEEKITAIQGLSPGTLQCLEKNRVGKKWRRVESQWREMEKSREPIRKAPSFSAKKLRK